VSERRSRRIEIPHDVAAGAAVPDDLDSEVYGPYAVPEPAQRRSAGLVYLAAGIIVAIGVVLGLPSGMWLVVGGFAALAAHHTLSAWHLAIREDRALEVANKSTDFAVGHASAAINFEGWRAKPVWNVLVFSADDPPTMRGLVRVDALTGAVIDRYVEPITG
jgi:hypothetical protein